MKLKTILFGSLFLVTFFMSCVPEALPQKPQHMEDEIINIEKTASGDEDNPIDDRRNEG
jgi:hypothetical protein